jgi:hypothetical protein
MIVRISYEANMDIISSYPIFPLTNLLQALPKLAAGHFLMELVHKLDQLFL